MTTDDKIRDEKLSKLSNIKNYQKSSIKDVIPKNTLSEETRNELNKIKDIQKTSDRDKLVYRTNESTYSFKYFRIINTFGRDIFNGRITLKEANEDQSSLLVQIMNFKKKINHKIQRENKREKIFLKAYMHFLMAEKEFLMLLKVKYFQ